ncbi:hypothetical protein ACFXTH_036039 [Malus domestica]
MQIKKLDGSEFRNAFDRQSVRVGRGHGEKSTLEMVRCTNMGKPRQGKAGILLWMRRPITSESGLGSGSVCIYGKADEHALRSKKMDPDEVTSRRIRRRIDSRDGVARARGIYSIVHSLMPTRLKFEEELIKNVSGEAKKAQRKRFRLWCLEKLEALRNLI